MNYKHTKSLILNDTNLSPPIFIGACGRSGTTLLKEVLGLHHNIYAIKEDTFIFREHKTKAYTVLSNYENKNDTTNLIKAMLTIMFVGLDSTEQLKASVKIISQKSFPKDTENTFNKITKLNVHEKIDSKYDAFNFCANSLTLKFAKKRWLEKTAGNIRTFENILNFYPTAKLIHIYRDPRAVFSSWKNRPYFKDAKIDNIIACTLMWLIAIKRGISYKKKYPAQYLEIKYESLIQSPEDELKKACGFLEEKFDATMLHAEVVNSSFQDIKDIHGFSSIPLERWKKVLTKEELIFIDLMTKKERKILGYPDSGVKLQVTDLIKFPFFIIKIFVHASFVVIFKVKQHLVDWIIQKLSEKK